MQFFWHEVKTWTKVTVSYFYHFMKQLEEKSKEERQSAVFFTFWSGGLT